MRNLFKKNKGTYKISLIHEDTYFNMPKGLRDFKHTDEALRIRKSIEYKEDDNNFKKKTYYYITYKGKKIDSETKTRKELEIRISDRDDMRELLKNLGFREVFTVEKERQLYEFSHNNYQIEVLIDYIPILKSYFVEVEYMVESLKDVAKIRDLLFDFLKLFNIEEEQSITKSYLELILEKFKDKIKN